jgi:plasmid stabilization system protein ParE
MPKSWSAKRERQYEHIKEGLQQRGESDAAAEEIAARTVNKERAQHGEAKHPSPSSLEDMPAGRRGALHAQMGERGRTYQQLYNEAKEKGLKGRSSMSKAELEKKLSH